ncbi:MAG: YggT family protein [Pseudomonadota bacterium]
MNALIFLITTIGSLYLTVVLLRLWLQLTRADFYNPISQFVVKATQPIVGPLRRAIPSLGSLDTATLLFAYIIATAMVAFMIVLRVGEFPVLIVLLQGLFKLISQIYWIVFVVLIIHVILSWVGQGNNPVEYVIHQLTDPIIRPVRKIIPPIGGLDLSILIILIALQFFRLLINDFFGPVI